MAKEIPKDKTAYIIVGLFVIIAFFVIKGMYKGIHSGVVNMQEDVLYVSPKPNI